MLHLRYIVPCPANYQGCSFNCTIYSLPLYYAIRRHATFPETWEDENSLLTSRKQSLNASMENSSSTMNIHVAGLHSLLVPTKWRPSFFLLMGLKGGNNKEDHVAVTRHEHTGRPRPRRTRPGSWKRGYLSWSGVQKMQCRDEMGCLGIRE